MVRRNRPLIMLCGSTLLFLTGQFALQTVAVYYARDVLGNADLYIVLTVVQTAGSLIAAADRPEGQRGVGQEAHIPRWPALIGVAGRGRGRRGARAGRPRSGSRASACTGFGLGVINTLIFALQADTVDYGEWDSGVRAEGASYSVLSFTRKTAQGIGGALAAYTIGIGGYVSGGGSQTSDAVTSIRVAAGAIPAIATLAAAGVMLAYPLTEKAFRNLVAELAERRAQAAIAACAARRR